MTMLDSVMRHVPTTWDVGVGVGVVTLDGEGAEFQGVAAAFRASLPGVGVAALRIERVQNAHLFGMYALKKAECEARGALRELSLWHATSAQNAARIVCTNLDWRRAQRVRFGRGVSFAATAKYADMECNRLVGASRVALLCKVLVGNSHAGGHHNALPPCDADTTTGRKQVFVKFVDNEFYPEYVVHYDSPRAKP